jgi:integrase
MIRNYLTNWVARPLCEITPEMVVARHGEIAAHVRERRQRSATTGQASANKVMRGLRAIWNNALLFQLVPGLGPNPTLLLRAASCWFDIPRRRTRVHDQDLRAFYAAAMSLDNTTARDLVLTLLFTGLRIGEAATLQWTYVDLTSRMISIPPSETKTGNQTQEPSVIPMSDFVTDLLRARPIAGPYVFPARAGGPIWGARDALDEIRRTADLS